MRNEKTAIILGAGASVHYGFPTGAGLIDAIISSTRFPWINTYLLGGDFSLFDSNKVGRFGKILREYDPLSIDSFLSLYTDNQEIIEIGKQLIAHTIIKKQDPYKFSRSNKENWYKYLYESIFRDNFQQKIENDNFRIITFNYDLSLEYFFHSRLEKDPSLSSSEAWEIFLAFHSKIHHVYGSVYDYLTINKEVPLCGTSSISRYSGSMTWAEKANHPPFQETSIFHNNIRVIGDERTVDQNLENFSEYLNQAERVFVLGYGFDDTNNGILGLSPQAPKIRTKKIFCTNYGGRKIIQDKIDSIFSSSTWDKFISNKTVYDCLSEDFSF